MAELKREMGFWAVLALAIGTLVGSGLFFGSALGASYSGNMSLIAWLIMVVVSIYVASLFGELVSMFPKAGGAYEFSKQTYGRFFSFVIGWLVWLVANIEFAMLIIVALDYLLPQSAPFFLPLKVIISIALILLINYIAYIGLEATSITLIIFSSITVSLVVAIVIPGIFHVNIQNFSPFFTQQPYLIFVTMFFIAETFIGWESVTFLAEETKNPTRVIPKALITAAVIMGFLGLALNAVTLGIIPWQKLATLTAPLGEVSQILFGSFGRNVISLGIYFTMIGSTAAGIIATPRLIFALARDKLFLSQMTRVHKKYKTPYVAIIFQTIVSIIALFLCLGRYKVFLSLLVPLSFIMYIPIILSVPILRIKKPNVERPFKAPFGIIGPILVSILFAAVIYFWLITEANAKNLFFLGISLAALGIPIYFLLQLYYDPKAIIIVNDLFAYLALYTERFLLPISVREELIKLLGNIKDKAVLEFGCGVGTLTMHLAEKVSRTGKVYATDISKRELNITRNRVKNAGHEHVMVLHEKKDTVHPDIKDIDAAISVSALGYVQDLKTVLKEINRRLKMHGRIVFLEYDKFFYFIPNIEWLSNDNEIKAIFWECGYSVDVIRKRGILWQYIFIYGNKFRNLEILAPKE